MFQLDLTGAEQGAMAGLREKESGLSFVLSCSMQNNRSNKVNVKSMLRFT